MWVIGIWMGKLRNLICGKPKTESRVKKMTRPGGGFALNDPQRRWLETALTSLERGDRSALTAVYYGLITSKPDDVRRCAAAVRRALEPWPARTGLAGLWKNFYQNTPLCWVSVWWNFSPAGIEAHISDKDDLFAVLALGAFHPCDYFRKKCLTRLEELGGRGLPLALLSVNNWAEPLRKKALAISRRPTSSAPPAEVLVNPGSLEVTRRDEADTRILLQSTAEKIAAERARLSPEIVLGLDNSARRLAYHIIISGRLMSEADELSLVRRETEPTNQRRLAELLLARETVPAEVLDCLGQTRSAASRLALLKHWRADWSPADLEKFIYDANGGVREYARFLLRKNGVDDFAEKYRRAVQLQPSAGALLGLGECGGPEDAALVEPFLYSGRPALVKAALTALAGLPGEDCAETLLKFLTDPIGSGRAYFLALKFRMLLPPARLYELIFTTDELLFKTRLARLISQQDCWEQLPYLIKLLKAPEISLQWWAERQLRGLAPAYTKPCASQLALINQTMADEIIPPDIRKNLELILKTLNPT